MQLTDIEKEKFFDRVYPDPNSGCHLWGAGAHSKGYGLFRVRSKTFKAHRVAYEMVHGPMIIKT